MIFKGIIFDLDDTLYDYQNAHDNAFGVALKIIGASISEYNKVTDKIHMRLHGTASSHNKLLKFKMLCEAKNEPYSKVLLMDEAYWTAFKVKVVPYKGVMKFLQYLRSRNIVIGIVTNNTTKEQLVKLKELGVIDLIDHVVTSEDIGKEKPNIEPLLHMLSIMKLSAEDVVMVGDNYEHDILPASSLGMYGFYKGLTFDIDHYFIQFDEYSDLLSYIMGLNKEIDKLVSLSKTCGMRNDMVQAGGGNTSFKFTVTPLNYKHYDYDLLCIKSSGSKLVDMTRHKGYIILINGIPILPHTNRKKSIETQIHKALPYKYIVHLHPVQVNYYGTKSDGLEVFRKEFPESCIIEYTTPGKSLYDAITRTRKGEKIIFLMNHGVIVCGNIYSELIPIIESVLLRCEALCPQLNGYGDKYRRLTEINSMSSCPTVTYLSSIGYKHMLNTNPDKVVYCGDNIPDYSSINMDDIWKYPVIKDNESLYINGSSYEMCKNIEDVLCANNVIDNGNNTEINDIEFLLKWDKEKYRQTTLSR